jgi:predicted nicotinamide N-methyase
MAELPVTVEGAISALLEEVKKKPDKYYDAYPQQWLVIFHSCFTTIGTEKGHINLSSSEEARGSSLHILKIIFTPYVGRIFSEPARRVLLGRLIAVLLAVATNDQNRNHANLSLHILRQVCSAITSADALACFLPGISGGVCKIICGDFKQGHKLPCTAFGVWGTVLAATVGNEVNESILPGFRKNSMSAKVAMGTLLQMQLQLKSQQELSKIRVGPVTSSDEPVAVADHDKRRYGNTKEICVSRNRSWLYETTARISILVEKVVDHVKEMQQTQTLWKIRLAAIEFTKVLLVDCSKTMTASCLDSLVEILLLFCQDDNVEQVAEPAKRVVEMAKNAFEEGVWNRLENKYRSMLTSLPVAARGGDELKLCSLLLTMTGYANILETRLHDIFSIASTPRFCHCISKILEFDPTAITEKHLGPLVHKTYRGPSSIVTGAYYDVPFKYIRSRSCREATRSFLMSVGKRSDAEAMIMYLLDDEALDWTMSKRGECIYMVNEIFAGSSILLSPAFVEVLVANTIECKAWNDASDHFERQVRVPLLLSRLADICEARPIEFKNLLLDIVYPLLEKLGDPDPVISQAALTSVLRVCNVCGYGGVDGLIEANVDYLIDNICLKLAFLEEYPNAPRVIYSIVVHAAKTDATGALLNEIVETLLKCLDEEATTETTRHYFSSKHLTTLIKATHDLVVALETDANNRRCPTTTIQSETKQDHSDSGLSKLVNEIIRWNTSLVSPEDCSEPSKCEEEVNHAEPSKQNIQNENSRHEREVTIKVLKKLKTFLPGGSKLMKCQILETITVGFKLLAQVDNDLLPIVAELWEFLLSAFKSSDFPVFCAALDCFEMTTRCCPEFIHDRFSKKLWPMLQKSLHHCLEQMWTSKTSVSLEEISNVSVENFNSATRKTAYAARSPLRKRLIRLLSCFERVCHFAPSFLSSQVWDLGRSCCQALRVIPETFLSGEDHKIILSLLKNLKKIDAAQVFHSIILSEGFRVTSLVSSLPTLQSPQPSSVSPSFGEDMLLTKVGFWNANQVISRYTLFAEVACAPSWKSIFPTIAEKFPTTGVNFAKANKPIFPVKLQDGTIFQVRQNLELGLGAVVWDCGRVLSSLMEDLSLHFFENKTVIDLGCGTGFCGILAKRLGASNVVLSDTASVGCLAEENVTFAENTKVIPNSNAIKVESFDWCDEGTPKWVPPGGFDIVLASDCLYESKIYDDLLSALERVLANDGMLLLAYKMRHSDRELFFFEKLRNKGYNIALLKQGIMRPEDLQDTGLHLFICCKV